MTFKFFKGGETPITLHIVETAKEPLLPSRGVEVVSQVDGFCARFSAHFNNSQLSQAEFAALLSEELDTPVSQVNVSNWMKSTGPRDRPNFPQFQKAVLAAAEKVALRAQLAPHQQGGSGSPRRKSISAPVTGEQSISAAKDVASQIQEWLGQGLTPGVIQQWAEIDEATFSKWALGETDVPAARWVLVQAKARDFLEFLASRKADLSKSPSSAKPTKKS